MGVFPRPPGRTRSQPEQGTPITGGASAGPGLRRLEVAWAGGPGPGGAGGRSHAETTPRSCPRVCVSVPTPRASVRGAENWACAGLPAGPQPGSRPPRPGGSDAAPAVVSHGDRAPGCLRPGDGLSPGARLPCLAFVTRAQAVVSQSPSGPSGGAGVAVTGAGPMVGVPGAWGSPRAPRSRPSGPTWAI